MDRHEEPAPTQSQPRLLDQVRGIIRRWHYSIHTEQTFVDWIILFHGKRHPTEDGAPEVVVEAFRIHLAVQRKVAASTEPGAERHRVALPAGTEKGLRLDGSRV